MAAENIDDHTFKPHIHQFCKKKPPKVSDIPGL